MNLHDLPPTIDIDTYTKHGWVCFRITSITHEDGVVHASGTINQYYAFHLIYRDFEIPLSVFNMPIGHHDSDDIHYIDRQIKQTGAWTYDIRGEDLATHFAGGNR
jgi:hypothetical protein